jgi:hypothetical protein
MRLEQEAHGESIPLTRSEYDALMVTEAMAFNQHADRFKTL